MLCDKESSGSFGLVLDNVIITWYLRLTDMSYWFLKLSEYKWTGKMFFMLNSKSLDTMNGLLEQ